MDTQIQAGKAADFRAAHEGGKLLILPNIWDALSAKMVALAGFHSIATASVATALSQGHKDGEQIPFPQLMKVVNDITKAVDIPVTVDMERGFADTIPQLKENIKALLDNGAVGLNIEDSEPGYKGFKSIDDMRRRIEAIKETSINKGIPLVINARTDVFLVKPEGNLVEMAAERASTYKQAGADCLYPILISNYDDIAALLKRVDMPVNVTLMKPIGDLKKLEEIGVARVSLGPNLLNYALTKMRNVSEALKQYDTTDFFGQELLPHDLLTSLA